MPEASCMGCDAANTAFCEWCWERRYNRLEAENKRLRDLDADRCVQINKMLTRCGLTHIEGEKHLEVAKEVLRLRKEVEELREQLARANEQTLWAVNNLKHMGEVADRLTAEKDHYRRMSAGWKKSCKSWKANCAANWEILQSLSSKSKQEQEPACSECAGDKGWFEPAIGHTDVWVSCTLCRKTQSYRCAACDGYGGHNEPSIAHTTTWFPCAACKGTGVIER